MPRVLPSNARAILRMVLRSERGKYPKEELELFRKLESHGRNPSAELGTVAADIFDGEGREEVLWMRSG